MLYLMIHADYEGSDHCKKKNESPKKHLLFKYSKHSTFTSCTCIF